jgi:hypothetical protein
MKEIINIFMTSKIIGVFLIIKDVKNTNPFSYEKGKNVFLYFKSVEEEMRGHGESHHIMSGPREKYLEGTRRS